MTDQPARREADPPSPATVEGGWATSIAAWVLLVALPLALGAWLTKAEWARLISGTLLGLAVVLTFPRLRRPTRWVVGLMAACGIAALVAVNAPARFLPALANNGAITALVVACGLLSVPAGRQRYVAELARLLNARAARRPILRQGLIFWLSHVLGALLNISSISVLIPAMGGDRADTHNGERLFKTLHRGFAMAGMWSPFYATVAVVLLAYPHIGWSTMLSVSVPLVIAGYVIDMLASRRGGGDGAPVQPPAQPRGQASHAKPVGHRQGPSLWLACLGLVAGVVGLNLIFGPPTLLWVTVGAFVAAHLWLLLLDGPRGVWTQLVRPRLLQAPGITRQRNEIAVFTVAGPLAAGLAALAEPHADAIAAAVGHLPVAVLLIVVEWLIYLASHLGIHPVASILLIAHALPTEITGGHEALFATASLTGYTMTLLASPFSVTGQVLASLTGSTPWRQSVQRNFGYAVAFSAVSAVYFALLSMT